jgi:hypothetical protein
MQLYGIYLKWLQNYSIIFTLLLNKIVEFSIMLLFLNKIILSYTFELK